MSAIPFKIGDNAPMTGIAKVGGAVQDMTGWTIKSQLRRTPSGPGASDLIADLACSWVDPVAASLIVEFGDTTAWPVCEARLDIRLTSPTGERTTSSTVSFNLIGPVTRDE